jgi:hypothetical protein
LNPEKLQPQKGTEDTTQITESEPQMGTDNRQVFAIADCQFWGEPEGD